MWQSKAPLWTSAGYQVTREWLLGIFLVAVKTCRLQGLQMVVAVVPHTLCPFNQRKRDREQEPEDRPKACLHHPGFTCTGRGSLPVMMDRAWTVNVCI